MLTFINICAVIPLSIIVIQDLRYRYISWFLIPLLLVVFAGRGLFTLLPSQFVYFSLLNLAFVTIQLLVLTLYTSVKNKKLTLIINSHIGLGDILFFVVICQAFSPINFIFFYLVGLIVALVVFSVLNFTIKSADEHVPLAGIMSALMIVVILIKLVVPQLNFYDDGFLLSLISSK